MEPKSSFKRSSQKVISCPNIGIYILYPFAFGKKAPISKLQCVQLRKWQQIWLNCPLHESIFFKWKLSKFQMYMVYILQNCSSLTSTL